MKILIDINPLSAHRTGIGNYILHLTEALLRAGGEERYALYGPDVPADPFPGLEKDLHIRFPVRNRGFLEYLARRGRPPALPGDPDIYHLPYPALPFRCRGRLVVTVHDLAFLRFPEFVSDRDFMRHLVRSVSEQVGRADRILADSRSTARDIETVYGIPAESIVVVYPGFDRVTFHPEPAAAPDPALAEVPPRFVLSVGTIEPRKNHLALLRAFEHFVGETNDRETHLVLVGGLGWKYEPILGCLDASPLRGRIHHFSRLSTLAVAELYRRAFYTVYPSLYEGFGLPVLEAMACGSPVITTNVSSLPEVGGDAALLVDPHDVEELAGAMVRVAGDSELRARMRAAGLRHARRFPWEAAAEQALAVYRSLVGASA